MHETVSTHWQMPPQSAPPLLGSQPSLGSSTQWPPPGQGMPAMPPQLGAFCGTQVPCNGQRAPGTQGGATTTHIEPTGQVSAAHGLFPEQSLTLSFLKNCSDAPVCAANLMSTFGVVT